jgi:lipopolysaccharide biosynthesis regulator YciM
MRVFKQQDYWFPIVKGINLFLSDRKTDATDYLMNNLKKHPSNYCTLLLLGNLYREKGRVDKAIQIHIKLIENKNIPNEIKKEAMLSLGLDYHKAGLMERALSTFHELLNLDPKNIEAISNLHKLYEELKDLPKAIETQKIIVEHDASIRQSITLSFLHNEYGEELLKNNKYNEAIAHFREALFADKKNFYAYINMGKTYLYLNDYNQTIKIWEQLFEEAIPQVYLILPDLFELCEKLNLQHKIQFFIDKIKSQYSKNAKVLEFLINYLNSKGKYEEASEYLMQALELNSYSPIFHWHLIKFLQSEKINPSIKTNLINYFESVKNKFSKFEPHICQLCNYKSDEYLKRCPHCHEWNTLIPQ